MRALASHPPVAKRRTKTHKSLHKSERVVKAVGRAETEQRAPRGEGQPASWPGPTPRPCRDGPQPAAKSHLPNSTDHRRSLNREKIAANAAEGRRPRRPGPRQRPKQRSGGARSEVASHSHMKPKQACRARADASAPSLWANVVRVLTRLPLRHVRGQMQSLLRTPT